VSYTVTESSQKPQAKGAEEPFPEKKEKMR